VAGADQDQCSSGPEANAADLVGHCGVRSAQSFEAFFDASCSLAQQKRAIASSVAGLQAMASWRHGQAARRSGSLEGFPEHRVAHHRRSAGSNRGLKLGDSSSITRLASAWAVARKCRSPGLRVVAVLRSAPTHQRTGQRRGSGDLNALTSAGSGRDCFQCFKPAATRDCPGCRAVRRSATAMGPDTLDQVADVDYTHQLVGLR